MAALFGFATLPVRAEDSGHPLDSALEMLNLKAKPGQMPDFVQKSRAADTQGDYMPIKTKAPNRDLAPATPAEVKALTAELDAAGAAQKAGKRPKPPSAAAGGRVKAIKPKPLAQNGAK